MSVLIGISIGNFIMKCDTANPPEADRGADSTNKNNQDHTHRHVAVHFIVSNSPSLTHICTSLNSTSTKRIRIINSISAQNLQSSQSQIKNILGLRPWTGDSLWKQTTVLNIPQLQRVGFMRLYEEFFPSETSKLLDDGASFDWIYGNRLLCNTSGKHCRTRTKPSRRGATNHITCEVLRWIQRMKRFDVHSYWTQIKKKKINRAMTAPSPSVSLSLSMFQYFYFPSLAG